MCLLRKLALAAFALIVPTFVHGQKINPANQITWSELAGGGTGNKIGAVYQADQFGGADASIKINACIIAIIAAGGGTCDARVLGGAQTMSEEINLGSTAQVTSNISVTLLLPDVATWTWTGIADGTSCGIKQFSSTDLVGTGAAAQGNRMTLTAANGSIMDSLYCTDPAAGTGAGSYIRASGFYVENGGANSVFSNGLMDVFGLVDQSSIEHVDAYNIYGDAWHLNAICCGSSFSHDSGIAAGTNGGIPLRIGNSNVVQNAVVTDGSATITTSRALGCAFSKGDIGKTVIGTGIPSATTMTAWKNCRSITISQNATGSATETIGIYGVNTPGIPTSSLTVEDSSFNYPGNGEPNILISKNDYIGPILFKNVYMEPGGSNTVASIYQDIYAFDLTYLNVTDISDTAGKYTIESHAGLGGAYYGEGPWQVIGLKTSYGINDVTAGKIIKPSGRDPSESVIPLYLSGGYPSNPMVTCGKTTTCSNTAQSNPRTVWGIVALTGGTATVGSVTAWTATTSFACTGTDKTALEPVRIVNTSTSSITITGTGTDTIAYVCVGN